ncbi:hypothetical protein C1H46_003276 [Malus baccata]|uniref:Uncharacterized protein n=1 Tax=Malus baccata TaxID=106549 RepID=A0A540NL87_MALBA|nr:hypothetical protein C1H46_003276 [Malus baccata]
MGTDWRKTVSRGCFCFARFLEATTFTNFRGEVWWLWWRYHILQREDLWPVKSSTKRASLPGKWGSRSACHQGIGAARPEEGSQHHLFGIYRDPLFGKQATTAV